MIDFEIRIARPTDVAELVRLCADHAAYEKADYDPVGKSEKLTTMLFGAEPPLRCIVVEFKSKIVGYATFGSQCSTWLAAEYLYLDCLFVDVEFRGYGIGQRMMEIVYSQAAELGCREVQWQTPPFNAAAIRFYDRLPQVSHSQKLRFVWPVQAHSTYTIQPVSQER